MSKPSRKLVETLRGKAQSIPPVWLMRQAGRYLPEYRATRAEAGGFLDLCYTPKLAAEVTLQPIRRYGFDAAILFADILLVPDALGQPLGFYEGEGPKLAPIRSTAELASLKPQATRPKFDLVFERWRGCGRTFPMKRPSSVLRRPMDGCDLHGRRRR